MYIIIILIIHFTEPKLLNGSVWVAIIYLYIYI